MPTVEFKVYDRSSGAYLTSLANASNRQCQDVENDTGTGGVTLGLGEADLAHMVEGNIVRCLVDGTVAYAWVVGPMDQATVTADEEAGEERRISGRGTLGLWADGIVYPETGGSGVTFPPLNERRVVDVRRFDFAATGYDDSGWAGAIVVPPPPGLVPLDGTPAGWPLESQDWIWSRGRDAGGDHPPGHSYFRHTFSVAASTQASVYITADNGFEVFLDGEMLLSELRTPLLWPFSRSVQVDLLPGTHLIAVKAVNHDVANIPDNPAGVAMVVVSLDTNGDPTAVLTSTGSAGWKCVDYPAEPPGMTVGRIITTLYDEARARGALTGLTLGFTATHDSAGVLWPNAPDVALPVGDDYLQALRKLCELYCDVAMDPSSLRLDAWVSRGADRSGSVAFTIGTDITALSHRGGEQARASAILGRFGDHWVETVGSGRRQEKFLEMGAATSGAQAQRMTDAVLAERQNAIIATTTGFEPLDGKVPWVHYKVGDLVSAPNASKAMVSGRVKSLSLNETETDYDFVAEIGSMEADIIERLQKLARKSGHGALDGNFANATASSGFEGAMDPTGAFLTSATPDVSMNSLTDVASVWDATPAAGDYMGWNPDLGLNGLWEPTTMEPALQIGLTVEPEQEFGLDATAGLSSTASASDHTHGTPLPRYPQSGYPHTEFGSGAVLMGLRVGELYRGSMGVVDEGTYERTYIVSPVGGAGWGRASMNMWGRNNGVAQIDLFNDLNTDGTYEGSPGTTAPFSLAINGTTIFRALTTAPGASNSPDPITGEVASDGRIYYDAATARFKVSENGGAYINLVGSGSAGTGAAGTFLVTNSTASATRWTGSTEFVIDSSGRVGIGTASPAYKLAISNGGASGFEFIPGASSGLSTFHTYNRTASVYDALQIDAAHFRFTIGGNEKIRIDTNGWLGVGTTVPQEQLSVRIPAAGIVSTFFGPIGNNFIAIGNDKTTGNSLVIGYDDTGEKGYLRVWGVAVADSLFFKDTGAVGFGIDSPLYKLHMNGLIGVRASAGEFSAGLIGAQDVTNPQSGVGVHERLYVTSPSKVDGHGRAVVDLRGFTDGTAQVKLYNDLDATGAYGGGEIASKVFMFMLEGSMEIEGNVTNATPPVSIVPAVSGANARLYYDYTLGKLRISENGSAYRNIGGDVGTGTAGTFLVTNSTQNGTRWTSSSEMFLDSSGRLLITKASTYNNELTAGLYIQGAANDTVLWLGADPANDVAVIHGMQAGISWTTRALALNPNGGKVGIGTIAPMETLAVRTPTAGLISTFFGPIGNNYIGIGNDKTADQSVQIGYNDTGEFGWVNVAGGVIETLTLKSSGNVGIGISNPTSKLHVNGEVITTGVDIGSGTNTLDSGYWAGTTDPLWIFGTDALQFMRSGIGSAQAGLQVMAGVPVDGNGRAGITMRAGPASGQATITMFNDCKTDGVYGAGSSSTTTKGFSLRINAGNYWSGAMDWSAVNLHSSTGQVGIAMQASGFAGSVVINQSLGAVLCRNSADSAYIPIYASAFTPSSKMAKENLRSLDTKISRVKIRDLQLWKFDRPPYDNARSTTTHLGLMAEEVASIIPEAIGWLDGEPHALDYSAITTVLIGAVQEHDSEIEILKRENEALKARVSVLEAASV